MSSADRAKTQEDFIRDDVPIICATIAFGMGIDKPNVRWVIHYNMPKNLEGYYQEIGRAGRDGLPSDTVMFYSFADVAVYRSFIEEGAGNKEIELAKLQRIQDFAEAQTCRRRMLLSYFGEHSGKDCGNCDVCKNPPEQYDGTIVAQKALSALARLKENVGVNLLIDVLRGSNRHEILEHSYHTIKTYGTGKDISFSDWQHIMLQLLHQGLIEIAYDQNHVLKLTERSKDVLFEGKKIQLVKHAVIEKRKAESIAEAKEAKPESKTKRIKGELFERLRVLRKSIADQQGVPPYIVFNDNTLEDLAQKKPTVLDELDDITGMGEYKILKYGQRFLDEIILFIKEKSAEGEKVLGAAYLLSYELFKDGKSIENIAAERNLKPTTILSHLAAAYAKGLDLDIEKIVNMAEIQRIAEAVKLKGSAELKPIFEHLNAEIDYGKIRFAIAYLQKNGI